MHDNLYPLCIITLITPVSFPLRDASLTTQVCKCTFPATKLSGRLNGLEEELLEGLKALLLCYPWRSLIANMDCWQGVLMHTIFVVAQPTYLIVRQLINSNYFGSLHPLWRTLTIMIWAYIVTKISIPFFTSPLRHLPSPPYSRFPLGHLDFNGGRPPSDNIARMFENTPNNGLLVLWMPLFLHAEIIPTKPETLVEILNTNNYDWEKPGNTKKFLARTTGEGLINAEGNAHKAMRKAVAPAFSGHHIRELAPLFYAKGLAFADSLAREAAKGPVEVMAQMSRVTLDIIGAAGVGKDFNTIENDEDKLAKLYAYITDGNRGPLWLFVILMLVAPQWVWERLRGTPYARIANAQKQLRIEIRALIQEKKQLIKEGKSEQQKDIIAIIMRSGDFSDDYLVNQLLTFLAAGHDTTASALTWTIYLLATNPQIQDRLRGECHAHLDGKPVSDIDASHFDAETMPYLTAVCNETLRLYATVPVTGREAVKPTQIGEQLIPQGTTAMMSPWAINRDKTLWGPDADEYKPDRWLDGPDAAYGGASTKSPLALLTFLHGPRSCIGQGFARLEMKCLLAVLVMRFQFDLANPEEEVQVGGLFTIKPKGGLRVRLKDLRNEEGGKGKLELES